MRSQNSLEISLLRHLRSLIPDSVRIVILAGRGFGRAERAAERQELGFEYVVRIRPDVTIRCSRYRSLLRRYPVRKGTAHVLRDVQYRKDARVLHNLVIRWRPGSPKKRDDPWYLMTSLDRSAESPCQLYACNMSVEWAFRISKDELVIRPVWHQKEDHVRAHILVCFLAYVLWRTLAGWMQRSHLGDALRTVVEEFAKIKSGDVVLQARTSGGTIGTTIRLRCVTEPDGAQKALLSRLGLNLPRRLRRIDDEPKTARPARPIDDYANAAHLISDNGNVVKTRAGFGRKSLFDGTNSVTWVNVDYLDRTLINYPDHSQPSLGNDLSFS